MRADDFFAAAIELPYTSLDEITRGGGLVVVAPHPDDESLGCGGLIAEACAKRVAVRLVVVSDGVGSHPNSRRYPPAALRDVREAETTAAAAHLGLAADAIEFLRLPDTKVPRDGPLADAARATICAASRAVSAAAVCVTWDRDPHCDHEAAAALVDGCGAGLGGARVLAYPVWGWTLPPDVDVGPAPRGVRLDVARHLGAKAAAIAAHRSQTTDLVDDDPDGFRLAPALLAHFEVPYEILLDVSRETTR